MQMRIRTWEQSLLTLAWEARHASPEQDVRPFPDTAALHAAYAHCDALTAEHSRSFYLASSLLPADKRRATRALYAFCRITDDIVDRFDGNTTATLAAWRRRALAADPPDDDPVAVAWADTRARYRIPLRYAEQLIEGVAQDITSTRYTTFDELATYCYGVASTVGLMSMHVIGYAGPAAVPYAIKLGVALQLTNILRDVGEDWGSGRLYLPQEELATFGVSEGELHAGRVNERWRAFMRFQIARNRRLYEEAWPGIGLLDADGRFAIAAAADVYRAILDDIEAHDYDVFGRRAYVSRWGKLRRLPRLWWQSRLI